MSCYIIETIVLVIVNLLIFNFFKYTDKNPNTSKYVVNTRRATILIKRKPLGFGPDFPTVPKPTPSLFV